MCRRRNTSSNQASWRNGSASDSSIYPWSFLKVRRSNRLEVIFQIILFLILSEENDMYFLGIACVWAVRPVLVRTRLRERGYSTQRTVGSGSRFSFLKSNSSVQNAVYSFTFTSATRKIRKPLPCQRNCLPAAWISRA